MPDNSAKLRTFKFSDQLMSDVDALASVLANHPDRPISRAEVFRIGIDQLKKKYLKKTSKTA